jgi:ABC-type transporter Mla MlaB component
MGARARDPFTLFVDVGDLAADGATVHALARLVLLARRHGCEPKLCYVSAELRELIEFAGLSAVLTADPVMPGSKSPRC